MMKKLRILLSASLLVTALVSNANAFTTDGESVVNTSHSGWCSVVVGDQVWWYLC